MDRSRLVPLRDLVGVCVDALSRHRLRTVLAVTGIVIGVGTVTAVISVVEGARRDVMSQVALLGLNNIMARPRPALPGESATIGFDDVERVRVLLPFAEAWSPLAERSASIDGPRRSLEASVIGVGGSFGRIMQLTASRGRLLADLDVQRDARVGVLGATLARNLFGDRDPLGAVLTVAGAPYTVVGVLDERDSPGASGGTLSPRDLNTAVLVPVRRDTFFGTPVSVGELWARMPDKVPVDQGGAVLVRALQALHRGRTDFEVLVPVDVLRQRLRAQRTFSVVLGSVSLLALLSGGIGIMNMMLASVLERTNEIGLRRSVGARRRWILSQFLLESTVIAVAGGLIGIVAGAVASLLISRFAGWPTHVSLWGVAIAVTVSAVVGVFFGTYPALRAARLEPVEAVRYE